MNESTVSQIGRAKTVISRRRANGQILQTAQRPEAVQKRDFLSRIERRGRDECWEWKGGKQSRAPGRKYGIVWINGKKWKAHRLAWVYEFGPIPDRKLVCHKCDNPPCCNPNHLFIGTNRDNVLDCESKGRGNKEHGEARYNAVLTAESIVEIRRRYKARDKKHGGSALAKEFGVGKTMISSIINRRRWKHIA